MTRSVRWAWPYSGLTLALVLVAGALAACTNQPPLPRAVDMVDAFIRGVNARDAQAIVATFDRRDRRIWTAARVHRVMARELKQGGITRFRMVRTGSVPQASDDQLRQAKEPMVTHAPYQITYRSSAARHTVRLHGQLAVPFEGGRWGVGWSKSVMWPGVTGAIGWHIAYRWPPRASILDRNGNKLAVGSGTSRRYPFHAVGGTTLGYLGSLSQADLAEAAPGHMAGDLVGASGLEAGLEPTLAGRPGSRLEIVGRHDHVIATVGGKKDHPGHNVKTTLDMRVQAAAEAGYGSVTGGAIVIDPQTGDLLAVVSSSPIDPNNYVGASGAQPFNRALSGLYPPGSSMKVVTASAALDTGKVTAATRLSGPKEFRGVRNFESESFKTLTFAQATEFSVNTAFAQVALKLGGRTLHRYAGRFGFNRAPALSVGAATSSFPMPQDESDLMWGAVGQAQDLASPLEMASVAATVANHGVRMEPRITFATRPRGTRVISTETAVTMTQLMELVVRGGTGTAASIPGVTVAGKTGTAEVDVNGVTKDHAWFVCFAPAENPKVAVSVVVEFGGVGGEVAAPRARNILERVLPLVR
ncbi:MAG TPA: penicillin-binding protein 2 [Actinomycetota bacterium]|nr:penicillin-binding protein 2 [Actinomycetota bacterium]